jgi:hypothetical protein
LQPARPLRGLLPVGASAALKALLALGLSDTTSGVIARTTRQMAPSMERKKSRKRNGRQMTEVLDSMFT